MDVLTTQQRSFNMSRIRGKNTKPELLVRSLIHRLGFRYVLHRRDLPGCPDIVFPSRRKIIFVHGCFWHLHNCRYGRVTPQSNADFWKSKRMGNRERDRKNLRKLRKQGWSVLNIWECAVSNLEPLEARIVQFLTHV
jgi:DNA mismatch endonuclease, patch repair protein